VGARYSVSPQTGPKAHPASCTMGTGFFPRLKWLGHGTDHPPHSCTEIARGLELYLFFPCVLA